MLLNQKNLSLVAVIVLGICGVARGGHGPYTVGHCNSPTGEPCFPKRESYGYFPTTWRRWPKPDAEAAAGRQPEPLSTPAAQPTPTTEPESQGQPTQPETGAPKQPAGPPFGEEPPFQETPPPLQETPLPPLEETPLPPFDAPPRLPPAESDKTTQPLIDSTVRPDASPSNQMPEPPGRQELPAPDADLPPTMPNEDPFKDDPESKISPPRGAAPKSDESTRDEFNEAPPQAASRWRMSGGAAPERLHVSHAMPIPDGDEPRRLETDDDNAESEVMPRRCRRANPLRRASPSKRPESIVPTAEFTGAATAAADVDGPAWRRNPLRSN